MRGTKYTFASYKKGLIPRGCSMRVGYRMNYELARQSRARQPYVLPLTRRRLDLLCRLMQPLHSFIQSTVFSAPWLLSQEACLYDWIDSYPPNWSQCHNFVNRLKHNVRMIGSAVRHGNPLSSREELDGEGGQQALKEKKVQLRDRKGGVARVWRGVKTLKWIISMIRAWCQAYSKDERELNCCVDWMPWYDVMFRKVRLVLIPVLFN